MAAVKATHAMISAARHYIHFSHSVSQGGLYVCVIVVAWNCKLPHLIHMFPTNIYSHLCTVYKQELSQQTMSLRMQTWLAMSLSTTTYNRIVAKNSITTSALSVNGEPVARSECTLCVPSQPVFLGLIRGLSCLIKCIQTVCYLAQSAVDVRIVYCGHYSKLSNHFKIVLLFFRHGQPLKST